jgi:hypothetical protein
VRLHDKYFDSLLSIYDALFQRGQIEHLELIRDEMAKAEPGLPAFTAGLEASGRWCLANRALAQLMFWRPVPSFEPSPDAFAPSIEMVDVQRAAIAQAIAAGQLGPADVNEVVYLVSTFLVGVLSQAMANEPELDWGQGASRRSSPDSWPSFLRSTRPRGRDPKPATGAPTAPLDPSRQLTRRERPRRGVAQGGHGREARSPSKMVSSTTSTSRRAACGSGARAMKRAAP